MVNLSSSSTSLQKSIFSSDTLINNHSRNELCDPVPHLKALPLESSSILQHFSLLKSRTKIKVLSKKIHSFIYAPSRHWIANVSWGTLIFSSNASEKVHLSVSILFSKWQQQEWWIWTHWLFEILQIPTTAHSSL